MTDMTGIFYKIQTSFMVTSKVTPFSKTASFRSSAIPIKKGHLEVSIVFFQSMGATGISQFSAMAFDDPARRKLKLAPCLSSWRISPDAPGGICHSFLVGDSCGMMNKKQLVTLSQLYHMSVSVSLWVSLVRNGFLMPSPLFPLEYT